LAGQKGARGRIRGDPRRRRPAYPPQDRHAIERAGLSKEATMVTRLRRQGWSAIALGAALAHGLTTGARAQITDDESKCQIGTSLAQRKFATEKAKGLITCEQGARKSHNPSTDCFAPFGGATANCVQLATFKAEGLRAVEVQEGLSRVLQRRRLHGRLDDADGCYRGGHRRAES